MWQLRRVYDSEHVYICRQHLRLKLETGCGVPRFLGVNKCIHLKTLEISELAQDDACKPWYQREQNYPNIEYLWHDNCKKIQ